MDQAERTADLLRDLNRVVVFTGAGISAESGIPTYRGADGMWKKYDPEKFASIEHFRRDPSYYWSFFRDERYPTLKKARPNPGHSALARLEAGGVLRCVITQNIDGLHQEAGSRNVIELHGNARFVGCLDCGMVYGMEEIASQLAPGKPPVPECMQCSGRLKPTVVLFGESLPEDAVQEAAQEASACDAMICVGTSLVVYPAAAFPLSTLENGGRLVIVNTEPTPMDNLAEIVVRKPAGEFLPELAQVLSAR